MLKKAAKDFLGSLLQPFSMKQLLGGREFFEIFMKK